MDNIARISVLMPVGKPFDRIFVQGISVFATDIGAHVSRLDPHFSSDRKLGSICQSLEQADMIVSDITARNPNVMYLTGYAHGIGRKVILIAQHGEDFPFDPAIHDPIIYGSDAEFLRKELVARVRGQKSESTPRGDDPRAKFLSHFGDLLKKHGHEHKGAIVMDGPVTFVLKDQEMDLPLVQDLARRGRELGIRVKLM